MTASTRSTDLLIAGGGLAALSVIRALRDSGDARSVVVLAGEPGEPYDRPPLSKQVLTGSADAAAIRLLREGELDALDVTWLAGTRAAALVPDDLVVHADDGSTWSAADVVIATGARPRPLPRALDAPGVLEVRTLADSERLRDRLGPGRRVVIVGAGFIGLEVASSALERGCEVTVVEAAPVPLARVLGDRVGSWFADMHERRGVAVLCGRGVSAIEPDDEDPHRSTVVLDDGRRLPADVVVVGIGVVPETDWLAGSGVAVDDGVACDARGRTSRAHVWAAGDVARWPHPMTGEPTRIEQWQSAVDQGRVVGEALAGGDPGWDHVPYFWSDQHGRKIQFAGYPTPDYDFVALGADADDAIAVIFREGDRATGLLAVDRPRVLALGRRVLDAGGSAEEIRALLG